MLAAACFGGASAGNGSPPTRAQAPTQAPAEPQAGSLAAAACNLPHIWLLRQWRGYDPGRSPDLIMLPYPPNYIGSGYPHVGPWDYLERVPLLLYGPGYVKPVGVIKRDVTAADWAPTQAELLHFSHTFPDGHPLTDALVPATQRVVPPKLIVTVVWDAGGRDVLSAWPNSWPHIKSLIPKGAWYDNANMGSAPTSTAQGHATIGTGAFPNKNGIIGNHVRINGHITGPWRKGPNL